MGAGGREEGVRSGEGRGSPERESGWGLWVGEGVGSERVRKKGPGTVCGIALQFDHCRTLRPVEDPLRTVPDPPLP